MAQHEYPIIDVEDYLLLDRNSKHARYEYLDGELRMLAGGSPYYAAIIANLTVAIGRVLIKDIYRGMNLTGSRNSKNRKS